MYRFEHSHFRQYEAFRTYQCRICHTLTTIKIGLSIKKSIFKNYYDAQSDKDCNGVFTNILAFLFCFVFVLFSNNYVILIGSYYGSPRFSQWKNLQTTI